MKKILCAVMILIMSVSLMTVSVSAAGSPKLNASSVNLPIGYAAALKVSGASGDIKWSSADSKIAEVKSSGSNSAKVTGKKTGETYIYAKTGGKTLKCKVTVKQSFITAGKKSLEIEKGKSASITFTVKGSKDIAVNRSDKGACSVSWGKWDGDKIKLTVKGKSAGTCVLTVYTKGYSKSTAKTVTIKITDSKNTGTSSSGSLTEQVLELVNKERKDAGKTALSFDDKLNEVAQMRAEEITKKFSHTRPDGTDCFDALDGAGIKYYAAAENIAMGQKTAESVMKSWLTSPGHKENMLNSSFSKTGIGTVVYNGRRYWVQVFAG